MAAGAVGVHPTPVMTFDTPAHANRNERLIERHRHSFHVPVADCTLDLAQRCVPPMREIDVRGHSIDFRPWDLPAFRNVSNQLLFFNAVGRRLIGMTVPAYFNIGNRRPCVRSRIPMALGALHFVFLNMEFVAVLDGLLAGGGLAGRSTGVRG